MRRLLERRALAYPGLCRIHVAAPSVQDALARRYGIGAEHVLVVTPAVNLDEFRPPPDKDAARAAAGIEDPDMLSVFFCGSDFGRKGLDRAILALAEARAKAMLLVVGGGHEEPYRSLAASHGVGERVRFLGARGDAWRFYQAADVFVLPTRADVWGVTPIEAMACGVPPIVSAAAGSSSAVDDGETGFVLEEPFDLRALRDAIDALAADPARRQAMGEAGVASARGHSWTKRLEKVEGDLVAVAEGRGCIEPVGRPRRWRAAAALRKKGPTL
jgi:UDP-glucose:(heptosyl)LPS alpha-1,3-glucosyltransferase